MSISIGTDLPRPSLSEMDHHHTSGRPRSTTFDKPGSVRINVSGAFIVDDETGSPVRHETKDIRLPHHTTDVSHIAVDVSRPHSAGRGYRARTSS